MQHPASDGSDVLRFIETTSGPWKEGGSAIATSLAIESKRPVRITDVEPIADRGLKVTYLDMPPNVTGRRQALPGASWDREGKRMTKETYTWHFHRHWTMGTLGCLSLVMACFALLVAIAYWVAR